MLLTLSLILYFSIIGLKTNKFNDLIISKIREIEPNLDLKIKDVSAKLNLFSFTIEAKTLGSNLIYKNKIIELQNIKTQFSLESFFKKKFSLSQIMISTKSIPIKNLISVVRSIKNDTKLLIAEQFIDSGYIISDLKFEFDEAGKIKKNYYINGSVDNAQISILKKKVSKLNFIFQITENNLNFNDVVLLLNNKRINIPKLKAQKQKNEFIFSGKLENENLSLNKNEIQEFISNEFSKINFKEITFNSQSSFNFKIDRNFKIQNLDIKSKINLENLKMDNFYGPNSILPQMKNEIVLQDQKIDLSYVKDRVNISGSGDIFLQDNSDLIEYKIIYSNDEYLFDINLNIFDNLFNLDFFDYEKNKKSKLDLFLKGILKKNNLFFDKIKLSENTNILSISNLELSKNYKINKVDNINIDFEDKSNRRNTIEFKKKGKNYEIIGDSFNLENLVTELLKSKKKKDDLDLFNNDLKILVDIKKVFLDENYTIDNLKGSIFLKNNKINDLSLESEFTKNQKINFTMKQNNGERVTTLFSDKAKPLVDRYNFIKGFSEGKLDFYSIKKNNETNSILKIYDFKLNKLPILTKILTLASLQGIADLLSGEGIRFSELEMNFNNKNNLITINEIYAIGPAISLLMEGYVEIDDLISLRGTLVPATTINKTIRTIPLIGDILVGKKVGEGVFGVSFKIKGPPNNLETTVNPIKTLTPRFITRTLEKIKKN